MCIPERDDHEPTGFEPGDSCVCGQKRIILNDGMVFWEENSGATNSQ
jgi:hypothetical protein